MQICMYYSWLHAHTSFTFRYSACGGPSSITKMPIGILTHSCGTRALPLDQLANLLL
jgi:hypothetical protein